MDLLIVALELGGLVLAAWVTLERAVVQAISLWTFVVKWVVPVAAFICVTGHAGRSGRGLIMVPFQRWSSKSWLDVSWHHRVRL